MHKFQLNGVLLAGGLSRRFGSPKAFAVYKDKYFYQWILEVMEPFMDTITIVSHDSIYSKFPIGDRYTLIKDDIRYKGFGPLAGIYSAMKMGEASWYFVLACDMPNLSPKFIKRMLEIEKQGADIIIPNIKESVHPLAGLYHNSVLNKIESLLETGNYKMKSLLDVCNTLYVNERELQVDIEDFVNINDQNEYNKFILKNNPYCD